MSNLHRPHETESCFGWQWVETRNRWECSVVGGLLLTVLGAGFEWRYEVRRGAKIIASHAETCTAEAMKVAATHWLDGYRVGERGAA